jgi:ribosomal protein L40E
MTKEDKEALVFEIMNSRFGKKACKRCGEIQHDGLTACTKCGHKLRFNPPTYGAFLTMKLSLNPNNISSGNDFMSELDRFLNDRVRLFRKRFPDFDVEEMKESIIKRFYE